MAATMNNVVLATGPTTTVTGKATSPSRRNGRGLGKVEAERHVDCVGEQGVVTGGDSMRGPCEEPHRLHRVPVCLIEEAISGARQHWPKGGDADCQVAGDHEDRE